MVFIDGKEIHNTYKKNLKGDYQILHGTPTRREDSESVILSKIYSFSFCSAWWIYTLCELD